MTKGKEKDYECLLADWPDAYYRTRDAYERKRLLEMSADRGLDPEGDKIRAALWEIRYRKMEGKADSKNKGLQDTYLKAWMTFNYAAERMGSGFVRRSLQKELKKELENMGPDVVNEYGELGEKVLYDELYHMVNLYIQLCADDRAYGSVFLGLGKMKKESFVGKIADEIYSAAYRVPVGMGLEEESRLLTKAATEAFYDAYPDYENYLSELIDRK